MARPAFHELPVARVDRLCADAVAVTFDVPPHLADTFAFRPGQYLTLRQEVDGAEERRSYSICAPAGAAPRIGVRRVENGLFSTKLVDDGQHPGSASTTGKVHAGRHRPAARVHRRGLRDHPGTVHYGHTARVR